MDRTWTQDRKPHIPRAQLSVGSQKMLDMEHHTSMLDPSASLFHKGWQESRGVSQALSHSSSFQQQTYP